MSKSGVFRCLVCGKDVLEEKPLTFERVALPTAKGGYVHRGECEEKYNESIAKPTHG